MESNESTCSSNTSSECSYLDCSSDSNTYVSSDIDSGNVQQFATPKIFNVIIRGRETQKILPQETIYNDDRLYEIFPKGWTDIMAKYIWKKSKSQCSFKFKNHKFYKREGYPYFDFKGKCMETACKASIKGTAKKKTESL